MKPKWNMLTDAELLILLEGELSDVDMDYISVFQLIALN